jgi:hypothetical protein
MSKLDQLIEMLDMNKDGDPEGLNESDAHHTAINSFVSELSSRYTTTVRNLFSQTLGKDLMDLIVIYMKGLHNSDDAVKLKQLRFAMSDILESLRDLHKSTLVMRDAIRKATKIARV